MAQLGGMKIKLLLLAVAAGLSIAVSLNISSLARAGYASSSPGGLAEQAVSIDSNAASSAIKKLRAEGPAGLDALFATHAALIQRHFKNGAAPMATDEQAAWQRLQNALDAVSAQHDCSASRLYWYTNFDDAKAAAKASGKPILSLRLLGNLNEEYSCANSRFFRTTLYANAEVSKYLRDHFILHWKSVRPVPRITVDFGDGRKIERTITGNSIHYILDPDGTPIDALPGLYGPKAFLKGLAEAETAALQYVNLSTKQPDHFNPADRGGHAPGFVEINGKEFLRQYHSQRLAAIKQKWRADMISLGDKGTASTDNLPIASRATPPLALSSANIAVTKAMVQVPMLRSIQNADDNTWVRVAALHSADATLDKDSVSLIASKNPTALEAGRMAASKTVVESPLTAMMRNLQRSIAEDTVRNEYLLHSQIHEWFVNGTASENVDQLNGLVYANLFLTPDFDPWLGLVPQNTFTGLDNNGLVQVTGAR
jgi:hypothetical protein